METTPFGFPSRDAKAHSFPKNRADIGKQQFFCGSLRVAAQAPSISFLLAPFTCKPRVFQLAFPMARKTSCLYLSGRPFDTVAHEIIVLALKDFSLEGGSSSKRWLVAFPGKGGPKKIPAFKRRGSSISGHGTCSGENSRILVLPCVFRKTAEIRASSCSSPLEF